MQDVFKDMSIIMMSGNRIQQLSREFQKMNSSLRLEINPSYSSTTSKLLARIYKLTVISVSFKSNTASICPNILEVRDRKLF
jgi:hypothetical protein